MAPISWGCDMAKGRALVGASFLVTVLLLAVSNAQQGGVSGGKTTQLKTPVRVNPNTTAPPQTIFYMGKVVMDTGMEPPAPVAVIRVCNGSGHREAFTSSDGSFSFTVGDRNNSSNVPDASEYNRQFGSDSQYSRSNPSAVG